MKCAFHVHTCFSSDCRTPLEAILDVCEKHGIKTVMITDHNTTAGAVKLRDMAGSRVNVIIGEEITTCEGELIGLFLTNEIVPGQTPESTIDEIRRQGGLVCVPHPFDSFRKERIKEPALMRVADDIDIVEVFNSRNVFGRDNQKAFDFAASKGKLMIAGCDAHTKGEIVNGLIEIREFDSKEQFLINLKDARLMARQSPLFVHFRTKFEKIMAKVS